MKPAKDWLKLNWALVTLVGGFVFQWGVINTKVEAQGTLINKLEKTTTTLASTAEDYKVENAKLAVAVTGLTEAVGFLRGDIKDFRDRAFPRP